MLLLLTACEACDSVSRSIRFLQYKITAANQTPGCMIVRCFEAPITNLYSGAKLRLYGSEQINDMRSDTPEQTHHAPPV